VTSDQASDQARKIIRGKDMLRFTANRATLANALAFAMLAVPRRVAVPVLAGVVFEATSGGLRIRGFDYEITTLADVPADVEGEGTILAGAATLAAWIKALPKTATAVTFAQSDGCTVRVSAGMAYTDVALMPVEDYPTALDMPGGSGTVSLATFADVVDRAALAAGTDETLPYLTGVMLRGEGHTLSADATDRYRMVSVDVPWAPAGTGCDWSALVPAGTLSGYVKAMRKVVGRKLPGDVTVGCLAGSPETGRFVVHYSAGDGAYYALATRVLDHGNYPGVRALYPTNAGTSITVDGAALAGMVKRVCSGPGTKTDPAVITFDADGTITATYGTKDDGSPANVETMTGADVSGDTITIGFTGAYLVDALSVAGAGMVRVDTQANPAKPVVMRPAADQAIGHDVRHLIMPIRLDRGTAPASVPAAKTPTVEAPEAHAYVAKIGERRCAVAGCDRGRTAKVHAGPAAVPAVTAPEAPAAGSDQAERDQADTVPVSVPVPAAVPAVTAPEAPAATVDQADTVPAATAPAVDQADSDQAETVAARVRELVAAGTWSIETVGRGQARRAASVLRLPDGRLDRDTYVAVRETLATVGSGTWDKTARGFAFPSADCGNPWRAATASGRDRVSAWLDGTAVDQAEAPAVDQADTVQVPAARPAVDQAERNRRRLAAHVTREARPGTLTSVSLIGDAVHVKAARPDDDTVSRYMGRAYRFERGITSAMGAPTFRYVPVAEAPDVDQADADTVPAAALADGRAVAGISARLVAHRAVRILPAGALAAVPTGIGPADFDAYRADIRGCSCTLCVELAYARPLDFDGREKREAARVLLAALRAGTHDHVTFAEHVGDAKAAKAVTLVEAHAAGATPERIATIERGYVKASMSDFYGSGLGIGMTPRPDRDQADTVPVSVPVPAAVPAVAAPEAPAVTVDQPDNMPSGIDATVSAWNAALASGDADRIKAAQRAALVDVARRTMNDDPRAPLAGWTVDRSDTVPASVATMEAPDVDRAEAPAVATVRLVYADTVPASVPVPAAVPAVTAPEVPAVTGDQADTVPAGDTFGAHAQMIHVSGRGAVAGYRFHVVKGTAARALAKDVRSAIGRERATVGGAFSVTAPAGTRTINVVPAEGHTVADWSPVLRMVSGLVGAALVAAECTECDRSRGVAE
jgi:DNA polymerase-3 subunit beta